MLKLLSFIAILCFVGNANAQSFDERIRDGANIVRLLLGSSQGATNFGLDYERRTGVTGLGAFIFLSADRDASAAIPGKPEQMGLGVTAPIHLIDRSNYDVYIAPALTALMTNDIAPNNEDETTFGPALKIGTLYHFSDDKKWSAGLDFMTITNWFSDKVEGSQSYVSLAVGYVF